MERWRAKCYTYLAKRIGLSIIFKSREEVEENETN